MSDTYRPRLAAGKKLPPHLQPKTNKTAVKPKAPEPEDDDGGTVVKKVRRTAVEKQGDGVGLPKMIRVDLNVTALHRIPKIVARTPAFKWQPPDFMREDDRWDDDVRKQIMSSEVQDRGLRNWIDDPGMPYLYSVAGSPSDEKALYFAAYLAQVHAEKLGGRANIHWHRMYDSYKNKLLEDFQDVDPNTEPSLLIISNLTCDSESRKLGMARDLLVRFAHIPRIVVSAGMDPISFAAFKLRSSCNAMAYFRAATLKQDVI